MPVFLLWRRRERQEHIPERVEGSAGDDYWKQTPSETLMVKKNARSATNDLARLAGVRSVLSNEVEEGSRLTPLGNSATVADTPTGIARERTKKKPRVNGAFSRNLIPNCVRHVGNGWRLWRLHSHATHTAHPTHATTTAHATPGGFFLRRFCHHRVGREYQAGY